MRKQKSWFAEHPIWTGVIGLVLLIIVISIIIPNDSEGNTSNQNSVSKLKTTSQEETSQEEESLEYKLAVVNKGGYVSKDDISVNRFRYLLNSLEGKTKQTKQEIADMSVNGLKMAREKYGIDITLLELMEGTNDSIPEEMGDDVINYAEIVVLYIELLK